MQSMFFRFGLERASSSLGRLHRCQNDGVKEGTGKIRHVDDLDGESESETGPRRAQLG